MTTRLRFAPSPTGMLHIGNARTALFNWLYARHTGGQFLIRIEDTDKERSTDESRDSILEALAWLGMESDEPYLLQSTRVDEHIRLANQLLAEGKAYKCFCSKEELTAMREAAQAEGRTPKYDGTWRDRTDHPTDGRPYTVRFKMPLTGATTVKDVVLGEITVANEELDDLIILRSDGSPTYNFVVVCDDAFMKITHVVRGQDHMTNTFRQVHLYRAMGHEPPQFGHLPLVGGLSKRLRSGSLMSYREKGFLPEAIVNYIARLGWSHGDQEIFSIAELIEKFDLADVNRSNSSYDEQKFAWVLQQWMKKLTPAELAERAVPYLAERDIEVEVDDRFVALIASLQERSRDMNELADGAVFAYRAPTEYDEKAKKKWMKAGAKPAFEALIAGLEGLTELTSGAIEALFDDVMAAHEVKMGKVAQPIRVALTGTSVSPPIFETLIAVGRDEAVARMKAALDLFPDPA